MVAIKGLKISGHYVLPINAVPFHICILNSKKNRGRTKSYFVLFLTLNYHQTRRFNFGLRRFRLNDCKFKLK